MAGFIPRSRGPALLAGLWLLHGSVSASAAEPSSRFPTVLPDGEEALVDLSRLNPRFVFDIRYATADNFFSQKVYPVARCLLRASVAARMVRAQAWLDEQHPGLRLMFKDCYRPDDVQWIMWKAVAGTKKAQYVANPNKPAGSLHNYGAAVDVTLADSKGREVDMGTSYDFLGKLAEPRHEARYLAEGKLTESQIRSRKILRESMTKVGMQIIRSEWWHFNAASPQEIRRRFSRLNVPLD